MFMSGIVSLLGTPKDKRDLIGSSEGGTIPASLCVSISSSKDNTSKATVGFAMANAAVAAKKDTMVFLSIDGVRLSQKRLRRRHSRAVISSIEGPDIQLHQGGRQNLCLLELF